MTLNNHKYRVVLIALLALIAANYGFAQDVPSAISYQGKLTDTAGQPLPDGTYSIQFKLYAVETGGAAFWSSSIISVQTHGGVFTTFLQ